MRYPSEGMKPYQCYIYFCVPFREMTCTLTCLLSFVAFATRTSLSMTPQALFQKKKKDIGIVKIFHLILRDMVKPILSEVSKLLLISNLDAFLTETQRCSNHSLSLHLYCPFNLWIDLYKRKRFRKFLSLTQVSDKCRNNKALNCCLIMIFFIQPFQEFLSELTHIGKKNTLICSYVSVTINLYHYPPIRTFFQVAFFQNSLYYSGFQRLAQV